MDNKSPGRRESGTVTVGLSLVHVAEITVGILGRGISPGHRSAKVILTKTAAYESFSHNPAPQR